jgi:hypothetical protein
MRQQARRRDLDGVDATAGGRENFTRTAHQLVASRRRSAPRSAQVAPQSDTGDGMNCEPLRAGLV